MGAKILFVEDDEALAMGTSYVLESEGMQVIRVDDCQSAKRLWSGKEDQVFDLVLLDVMLPDGDGFALCQWLKSEQEDIPVIFLTALEDEGNVVHGLQYGDDYVTKPFRTKELVARILANIRKYKIPDTGIRNGMTASEEGVYQNGELCLNEKEMLVYRNKERIELTRSEYRLFQILIHHAGQILTREQLMEQLWSVDEAFVDDNTLSVYMRRLRQKLGCDEEKSYISTIRGVGYRMELGKRIFMEKPCTDGGKRVCFFSAWQIPLRIFCGYQWDYGGIGRSDLFVAVWGLVFEKIMRSGGPGGRYF